MKKIISVLTVFVLLALMCVPMVSAAEPEFEYELRSDGTIAVTAYKGKSEKMVVPSEIDGYTVKVYKINRFKDLGEDDIKTVILPDTIVKIKTDFDMYRLQKVVLPKNLKTIPSYTFSYCRRLEDVTFPETLKTIGDRAFSNCIALKNITLPDSVSYIGKGAFRDCSLESVNIPQKLRRIGAEAFKNSGLTGELTIPDTVRFIGRSAFLGNAFESVTIGRNVKEMSPKAFINNAYNTSFTVDENNRYYTDVDGVLFTKDEKKLVHYPEGRRDASYTVADGVEEVSACAFAYSYLESVTVGKDVKNVANKSFKNCINLKDVKLPDGLARIGEEAFSCCRALNKIEIPDSIKKIKCYTFYCCDGLYEIKLPADLQVIEKWAFACTGLTEFTVPDTIKKVEPNAFSDSSIAKVTFPNKPDSCFKDCLTYMWDLREIHFLNPNPKYYLYYYYLSGDFEKMTFGDVNINLTVGASDELDSKVFAFYDDDDSGMGMIVEGTDVVNAELVDDSYVAIEGLKQGTAKVILKRGAAEQTFNITVE